MIKGAIGTRREKGAMVWWVEKWRPPRFYSTDAGHWERQHSAPHHLGTAMAMGTKQVLRDYLSEFRLRNAVTDDTISLNELHRGEIDAFLVKTVHAV